MPRIPYREYVEGEVVILDQHSRLGLSGQEGYFTKGTKLVIGKYACNHPAVERVTLTDGTGFVVKLTNIWPLHTDIDQIFYPEEPIIRKKAA